MSLRYVIWPQRFNTATIRAHKCGGTFTDWANTRESHSTSFIIPLTTILHYRFPSRLKITVVQEPPKIWFYSFAPISWTHSITKSLRREGLEMTISQHCLWIRYNSSLKPKLKIWLTVNVKGFTAMAFCWILKPMQLVEYKTMIYHANCPFSKGYSNKIHKGPPHKLYRNDIANMVRY